MYGIYFIDGTIFDIYVRSAVLWIQNGLFRFQILPLNLLLIHNLHRIGTLSKKKVNITKNLQHDVQAFLGKYGTW